MCLMVLDENADKGILIEVDMLFMGGVDLLLRHRSFLPLVLCLCTDLA